MRFKLWSRKKKTKPESEIKSTGEWVHFEESPHTEEPQILFALFTEKGTYLSLDPSRDEYNEVESGASGLRIWDYQAYSDPEIWFMGNNPRPKVSYSIRRIPPSEVQKLG